MNGTHLNTLEDKITYSFYDSILSVNIKDWNEINTNIYLSVNYLTACWNCNCSAC